MFYLKKPFLVGQWLINFSNQLRKWLKWLKTMGSVFCEFRAKTFREGNALMGLTTLN